MFQRGLLFYITLGFPTIGGWDVIENLNELVVWPQASMSGTGFHLEGWSPFEKHGALLHTNDG